MWHVYLLECIDGSTYTGIAVDVDARYQQHVMGRGARYTRAHPPRAVIAALPIGTRMQACQFERRIKRWPQTRKVAFFQAYAADWRVYRGAGGPGSEDSPAMTHLQDALARHTIAMQQLVATQAEIWTELALRAPSLARELRQSGWDESEAARWACFQIEELGGAPAALIASGQADQVLSYVLRVLHGLGT